VRHLDDNYMIMLAVNIVTLEKQRYPLLNTSERYTLVQPKLT